MSGKRLGIVRIKLAAELLESLPGASIDIGGTVRTPVLGGSAMLGFTEQIKESVVECEIAVGVGTSLVTLNSVADTTLTFECDTGQVYVVRNACLAEPPKATAGEGKATLKFFGQPAEELGV